MKKKRFEYFYRSTEDIPLILDSYDDIFSDFDPRPYSEKALSGDFLLECKKASADKRGKIKLRLFVPKQKRSSIDEIKIKKRLKEHFCKHLAEKKRQIIKIKLNGFNWFISGCLMLLLATVLLKHFGSFWFNLIITITIPSGWFFLWEGLGKIFITAKEKIDDYDFNKKMSNALIYFINY
jgi:hypothetical protein